jgi:hypothetical protein
MDIDLLWDASYLGTFDYIPWEYKIRYQQRTYAFLDTKKGWQAIHVVRSVNLLHVIIDEMANYFGLPKRGSHTLHVKKTFYIIYYVSNDQENTSYEIQLSKIDKDVKKQLYEDIIFNRFLRNLYTLAYSFQLKLSEANIIVRKIQFQGNTFLIPILFLYTKCQDKLTLAPRIRKKLFNDLEHKNIMKILINKKCNLKNLKMDINDIIYNINKEYTWLSQIFNRSLQHM